MAGQTLSQRSQRVASEGQVQSILWDHASRGWFQSCVSSAAHIKWTLQPATQALAAAECFTGCTAAESQQVRAVCEARLSRRGGRLCRAAAARSFHTDLQAARCAFLIRCNMADHHMRCSVATGEVVVALRFMLHYKAQYADQP